MSIVSESISTVIGCKQWEGSLMSREVLYAMLNEHVTD